MELYLQIAELVTLVGFVWWFRGWNISVDYRVDDLLSRVENLESAEQERTEKEMQSEQRNGAE